MKLVKILIGMLCFYAALGILLYTIIFQPEIMPSVISWIITLLGIGIFLKVGFKKFILYAILFYLLSIVLHFKEGSVIELTQNISEYIHNSFRRLFIRGL